MDLVGGLWLSVWLTSIFALLLAIAMFALLARLDSLPKRGCAPSAIHTLNKIDAPRLEPNSRQATPL